MLFFVEFKGFTWKQTNFSLVNVMSLFWELWSRIAVTLAGWLHEDEYFSLKISFLRRRHQQIIFLPNDWRFNGSWEFPFLRTHIFPVLSFSANVPVKVVLGVLGQIYFWQGFSFPNLMPVQAVPLHSFQALFPCFHPREAACVCLVCPGAPCSPLEASSPLISSL